MKPFYIKRVTNIPLQAWTPSNHVWSKFGSPGSPQFLYQAPPVVQQLGLPDFSFLPHLGHIIEVLIDVVKGSAVTVCAPATVGINISVGGNT